MPLRKGQSKGKEHDKKYKENALMCARGSKGFGSREYTHPPQDEKRRGETPKRKGRRGWNSLPHLQKQGGKNGAVRAASVYSYFWIDYCTGMWKAYEEQREKGQFIGSWNTKLASNESTS